MMSVQESRGKNPCRLIARFEKKTIERQNIVALINENKPKNLWIFVSGLSQQYALPFPLHFSFQQYTNG